MWTKHFSFQRMKMWVVLRAWRWGLERRWWARLLAGLVVELLRGEVEVVARVEKGGRESQFWASREGVAAGKEISSELVLECDAWV